MSLSHNFSDSSNTTSISICQPIRTDKYLTPIMWRVKQKIMCKTLTFPVQLILHVVVFFVWLKALNFHSVDLGQVFTFHYFCSC